LQLKKQGVNIFELTERIKFIHKQIKQENTGSYRDFALKLGLKKSQMYNILEELLPL
jgi:hypothetical protein